MKIFIPSPIQHADGWAIQDHPYALIPEIVLGPDLKYGYQEIKDVLVYSSTSYWPYLSICLFHGLVKLQIDSLHEIHQSRSAILFSPPLLTPPDNESPADYILSSVDGLHHLFCPSCPWEISFEKSIVYSLLFDDSSEYHLLRYFLGLNTLSPFEPSGYRADPYSPSLADSFHLYYSRKGFSNQPIGATFPNALTLEPLPLRMDPISPQIPNISLPPPTANFPSTSFYSLLQSRRSLRSADKSTSLSIQSLSDFLHLCFHTFKTINRSSSDPHSYESCFRSYPNGGGVHELEAFLVVSRVDTLSPLICRYNSFAHCLEPITSSRTYINFLEYDAHVSSNMQSWPDVLVVLASRLGRLNWKYERMAYSVSLRNAGVLLGHMSFVASFLDLYGSPMGNGNSLLFSRAIGLPPLRLPSIAEFCLSAPVAD